MLFSDRLPILVPIFFYAVKFGVTNGLPLYCIYSLVFFIRKNMISRKEAFLKRGRILFAREIEPWLVRSLQCEFNFLR